MITDIEDYFSAGCGRCKRFATPECSVQKWAKGLFDLRQICRDSGLTETVKWGHPCYMHSDRNIVILGAFKNDFRITFFNASLLKDSARVPEKRGPNTQNADMIIFHDNVDVSKHSETIASYISEAIAYAKAGIKPVKKFATFDLPDELVDALDHDSVLAEAFPKLTPGRQRSYVINLNNAKASATRTARIEKFRDKIIAGKGALER